MANMSQTRTLAILDTIPGVFCNEEIAIRVLHSWEARNFKKGNLLMGQELLLVDSQSAAIQGFIPGSRLPGFLHRFMVGKVYVIRRFMVKPSRDRFKVAENTHTIIFTDQTSVVETPDGENLIPKQWFRTRLFEVFSAIVDKDVDLFDVVGEVVFISGVPGSIEVGTSKQCVTVHLRLKDGETMRAYLWSNVAAQDRQRWDEPASKPKIILVTAVNPRTLGGVVSLKTTAASRVFFDSDVDETKELLAWVAQGCPGMPSITASSSAVTKVETATINDLHQFLQTADPEKFVRAGFYVHATIVGVPDVQKWNYISCSTCSTQLGKNGTSLFCSECNKTNNIGLTKFRFETNVQDTTGEMGTFVIFEPQGIQILGKTAMDVLQAEGDALINGRAPAILQTIVGTSWKFHIQIAKYNLTASRQTFTVTEMIEESHKDVELEKDGHDIGDVEPESLKSGKKPRLSG